MKKMLLFLSICIFFSCRNHYIDEPLYEGVAKDSIVMQNANKKRNILLTDVFDSISTFPIPTEDNYLIGRINRLVVKDSIFAILDNEISCSVFLYNKYTGWKSCIEKQGKGPMEYLNPCDIMFHPTSDLIGAFCNYNKKIIYYKLNGDFSHEYKIPIFANALHPIGKNVVAYSDYSINESLVKSCLYPNIVMCDSLQRIISCGDYFVKNINHKIVWTSRCSFSDWNDTLAIKPDHCNIVYHCVKDSVYAAHYIDFNKPHVWRQYWSKVTNKNIKVEEFENYCRQIGICETIWYLESEDYVYFAYRGSSINHILYSKRSNKSFQFNNLVCMDGSQIPFFSKAIYQNKLYIIIYPHDLRRNKYVRMLSEKYRIKESDNPVIVELSLKNF